MSDDQYNPIYIQLVPEDEKKVEQNILEESDYLKAAFRLKLDEVVGDTSDENLLKMQREPMWSDVLPIDGVYTFELATELPVYLPQIENKFEYVLRVGASKLFVCLRMVKAFYGTGLPENRGLSYYLTHRMGLKQLVQAESPIGIHPIPIKTFVSKRYVVLGEKAEPILRDHYKRWRNEFIKDISHLMDSIQATSGNDARRLLAFSTIAGYPIIWITVNAKECHQIGGDVGAIAFRPLENIGGEKVPILQSFLSQEDAITVHQRSLSLARSFNHYGYSGLSILQICIACETVLAQKFFEYIKLCGVSSNSIKDNKKNITFSQLLKIHLFSMVDVKKLQNSESILGKINWARGQRNDVVHEGGLQQRVTAKEIDEAIEAAESLIEFLLNVKFQPPGKTSS